MFWTCIVHESRGHLERSFCAVNCSAVQTEFGESQSGAEASSEGHSAKGQKSGLRAGINSGVCFGRPPFLCARLLALKVAPQDWSAMICPPDDPKSQRGFNRELARRESEVDDIDVIAKCF